MEKSQEIMKTGTTTVGIRCKDALILAADKRATVGYTIADKHVEKVMRISDTMAVTIAGSVSDIQMLVKYLRAELRLKELRQGAKGTVREAANMLASWVYHNIRRPSMMPGVTHFIFGGVDDTGLQLFDIFPDGTITEINDYFSSGSGSVFAFGALESGYQKELSKEEGVKLALQALNAAMQRDIASGNGCKVISITESGITDEVDKTVNIGIETN